MTWRISRNGQPKTKCTSIPRRVKCYLLREKGYNISLVRKQQPYIDKLSHHKFLGLIIDKDLSFEAHMYRDELCKKLSKRRGLLRHISPYLKQRHKLSFYLAAIKPVMLYLSPIWSSCRKELPERVLRMQKRAA